MTDTPVARRAESLVHGLDGGPVVLISGRATALLMDRAGLGDYRRAHRGDDADVDAALIALALAALHYRDRMSGRGQLPAPIADTGASLTTRSAADRLGCSPRTITRAIRSGQLNARRVGPIWLIDTEDCDRYAERREQ